jgi:hypothetical protein
VILSKSRQADDFSMQNVIQIGSQSAPIVTPGWNEKMQ